MRELLILLSEILFIALAQFIFEVIYDKNTQAMHLRIVNIICFLFSFLLVLQFAYTYILSEITSFVKLPF
jgi:hypothetical protein